jgi:hypothetical protein
MKNIFLIPTDKESRLWRDLDSNKLTFSNLSQPNSNECTKCSNEYVYITSDEQLKDGDWCHTVGTSLFNSQIGRVTKKVIEDYGKYGIVFKKIVMTNDPKLIKDGVQEIGERFFEWFVLNPTCEEVEIGKTNKLLDVYEDEWETKYHIYNIHEEPKKNFYCGDEVDYGEQCSFQCERCVDCTGVDYGYLPKEDLGYTTKMGIKVVDGMVRPLMVPKKYFGEVETIDYKLNNLADKWVFETNGHKWSNNDDTAGDNFGSFKEGYRTAQKTLYDENEVLELVLNRPGPYLTDDEIKEWFGRNKKK